tara:strand:+ start:621 stop:782 length:162 start_codon:yes stop_codon:yes gene_type:complete
MNYRMKLEIILPRRAKLNALHVLKIHTKPVSGDDWSMAIAVVDIDNTQNRGNI